MKILTLNVHGYSAEFGPWDRRRLIIAEALKRRGVEVVALQNVWQPGHEGSQVSEIAALVPQLRHHFFKASCNGTAATQGMGLLLAQAPLDEVREFRLSPSKSPEDPSPRIIIYASVETAFGPTTILNCHFSWADEENERNCQEALNLFRTIEGAKIVLGDFNSPAHGRQGQQFRADGWIDAWFALRNGEPGATYQARDPVKRIDQIWVSKELERPLRSIQILYDQPDSHGNYASEHLGVLLDLG